MPQMTTQSSDDDRIDCFVVHVLAHMPSLQSDPLSELPRHGRRLSSFVEPGTGVNKRARVGGQ